MKSLYNPTSGSRQVLQKVQHDHEPVHGSGIDVISLLDKAITDVHFEARFPKYYRLNP